MTQLSTGINDDKTRDLKKDQLNIDKSEIPEHSAARKEQGRKEIPKSQILQPSGTIWSYSGVSELKSSFQVRIVSQEHRMVTVTRWLWEIIARERKEGKANAGGISGGTAGIWVCLGHNNCS